MATLSAENIRNIALVGHNVTGKTSLTEALLQVAGVIKKKGTLAEKNTVSDFDPDEKERGHSIESSLVHFEWAGKRVNLLDCPGLPDFIAGPEEGLAAADCVLLAISAANGIEVMSRKLWGMAVAQEKARIIVLTKMDHERAKFDDVIAQLREVFGNSITPLLLPIGQGKDFKGVVNLLGDLKNCPPDLEENAKGLQASLTETVVATDDTVMERYLSDEKISAEEIARCLAKGVQTGAVVPVLCVSGEKDLGLQELLDVLVNVAPSPLNVKVRLRKKAPEQPIGYEEKALTPTASGPLYAQVFKSKRDAFIGKLSYLRVFSGSLLANGVAKSSSASRPDKFGHVLEVQGKDAKDQEGMRVGEIVAVAKNENLNFNDTLTTDESGWVLPPVEIPLPMQSLAVEAKNRNDEAKVAQRLRNLAEGDPTFLVEVDSQTHELVIRGMGVAHLELMLHRLRTQHIDVHTKVPKIPYRSTIAGT